MTIISIPQREVLGLGVSITLSLVFDKKMTTLGIEFDGIKMKSLEGTRKL